MSKEAPERIWAWRSGEDRKWWGNNIGANRTEYIRADLRSYVSREQYEALEAERDAYRAALQKIVDEYNPGGGESYIAREALYD